MKIPFRYNLSSMWVRRVGTAMTIMGIGLTASIVVSMMAMVHGLEATLLETGHDDDLVVLHQGSPNEVYSFFTRDCFRIIRYLPGVQKGEGGEPLAVGELVVVMDQVRRSGAVGNVTIRGASDLSFSLRPEVTMVAGRRFRKGSREINVSRALSERFQSMELGDSIHFSRSDWNVVGIFDSGGTAYDSEVWADYGQVCDEWNWPICSSVLIRPENAAAARDITRRIASDQRMSLQVIPQKKLYADQTSSSAGIRALGYFVALMLGIGATFAAMNMMYGTLMSRSSEVATLRSLGFRGRNIIASLMMESVALGLAGGVLGCLFALPMHGIAASTVNLQTFNEILFNFRITPAIILGGLLYGAAVGAAGGYLPARRAAQIRLIDLMRE